MIPATIENGRTLAFCNQSDEDLTEIINGEHDKYLGTMRAAIQNHARIAGGALNEMKRRVKGRKESWHDWVTDNFGSPSTARVYMRIDRDWDKIIEAGLESGSLEEMRSYLAEPKLSSLEKALNLMANRANRPYVEPKNEEWEEVKPEPIMIAEVELMTDDEVTEWKALTREGYKILRKTDLKAMLFQALRVVKENADV